MHVKDAAGVQEEMFGRMWEHVAKMHEVFRLMEVIVNRARGIISAYDAATMRSQVTPLLGFALPVIDVDVSALVVPLAMHLVCV